jgi:hypothetical protein
MMIKITNRAALIFLGLGLVSALWSTPVFSAPNTLSIDISLPTQSLDFSDIDVRDEFNRPVKDSFYARAFAITVQSLLLKSLVDNLTPHNRFIQNILSLKHDVICGWIKAVVEKTKEVVWAVLSSGKKWPMIMQRFQDVAPVVLAAAKIKHSHNNFFFLISSLLSSTQILR